MAGMQGVAEAPAKSNKKQSTGPDIELTTKQIRGDTEVTMRIFNQSYTDIIARPSKGWFVKFIVRAAQAIEVA